VPARGFHCCWRLVHLRVQADAAVAQSLGKPLNTATLHPGPVPLNHRRAMFLMCHQQPAPECWTAVQQGFQQSTWSRPASSHRAYGAQACKESNPSTGGNALDPVRQCERHWCPDRYRAPGTSSLNQALRSSSALAATSSQGRLRSFRPK